MKNLFILNPVAGAANSADALTPRIKEAATKTNSEVEIVVTTHPGHARELAQGYADSGEEVRIFACGGDGTLNEVLQAAVKHPNITVGCVPCGSGNDYVRNFGTAEDFLDLEAQLNGSSATVDAIETDHGYCLDICAAGLDAKVAYNIPKFRRLPLCGGSMAYNLSIIQVLFSKLGSNLEITVDDKTMSGEYMMAAICNGRLYGGGYMAAPTAMMDDGVLNVLLVKPISRLKIPGFLAKYKVGGHLLEDGVVLPEFADFIEHFKAKKIQIKVNQKEPLIITLDGESSPQMEMTAQVVPHCVKIALPTTVLSHTNVLETQVSLT